MTTEDCVPIKNFARRLSVINVERIEMTYDGSGDSGDSDVTFLVRRQTPPGHPMSNERPPIASQVDRVDSFSFRNMGIAAAAFTHEEFEQFCDALFELLPEGWEIDSGSFGEIAVDIVTDKVRISHHERYTEVRNSEQEV